MRRFHAALDNGDPVLHDGADFQNGAAWYGDSTAINLPPEAWP